MKAGMGVGELSRVESPLLCDQGVKGVRESLNSSMLGFCRGPGANSPLRWMTARRSVPLAGQECPELAIINNVGK